MNDSRTNEDRGFSRRPMDDREMHDVTCSDCGVETQVPFVPDGERPVYCRSCYQSRRPPRRNRY